MEHRVYASEVTSLFWRCLTIRSIEPFFKIFKVSEKCVIQDIRHFLGLHDVASLSEMRRIKFLNKTRALTHAILQS